MKVLQLAVLVTVFITLNNGYKYKSLNTALNQISINEPWIFNPPKLMIPNIGPIVRRLMKMVEKERKQGRKFRYVR